MKAFIVTDLGYGDAGKGSIVDSLVREKNAHTVIRFNGGAQAAHNVIDIDGRHHTFSQFGSGSFVPGVKTHLSRFMLVNPSLLLREGKELESLGVERPFELVTVDKRALVTTIFQQAINRLREIVRGGNRHGSCGMGIGETMIDYLKYGDEVLFAGDLNSAKLKQKLEFMKQIQLEKLKEIRECLPTNDLDELKVLLGSETIGRVLAGYKEFIELVRVVDNDYMAQALEKPGSVVFEGAQGVLLDQWYGFHPFTTWSTTTSANALELLKEHGYEGEITRVGLLRAYSTRHGAGPFVTESDVLTKMVQDMHNETNDWQHGFRVGWFDFVAAKYALEVNGGVDCLAITNMDRMNTVPKWLVCNSYDCSLPEAKRHLERSFGEINRIKLKHSLNDLEYQEGLTNILAKCQPLYERVNRNHGEYIEMIQDRLGVKAGIISNGPTAADKEYVGRQSSLEICA